MSKWARIDNGTVAEITDIDPEGRFHPSLLWVVCTEEVASGWKYEDGEFSPPELAPETVPVPDQVSRAQGKAALITAGLWPDVLAFVESITDPTEKALAEVALNDTTHWRRDSPFYNKVADHLGLSEEQKDELIIEASKIYL